MALSSCLVSLLHIDTASLYLDIVKNGDALLSTDNLDYYEFRMEEPVNLDNRLQYVVSFRPLVSMMYALFIGKLYIDYERRKSPIW